MAITATDRGTGGNNAAGTTISLTGAGGGLSGTMTAGNCGILCLMFDNAGGTTANLPAVGTTITDSAGNVWYLRQDVFESSTANNNLEGALYVSNLTANFSTSETLTVTFNNSTTAKVWTWTEASTNVANAKVMYNRALAGTAGAGTNSPTQTGTACITGDLTIGLAGSQSADLWTQDSDTLAGSWSTAQHTGIGTGATGMAIITQAKVATSAVGITGQTYNPTTTTTPICRVLVINFTEADIKARAFLQNGTAQSTSNITILQPLASGSLGVVCLAADNIGSGGNTRAQPTSLTDTGSNTWTQQFNGFCDPGAANAGVEISIYTSVLTTGLAAGDTITITWVTNAANKTAAVLEFAPAGAGVMTYVTGSFGNNSGVTPTTAPTVTTSSITSGDWVIAMVGAEAEDGLTMDSTTTNGVWRQQTATALPNTAGTAMTVGVQAKQVTATATQTYAPTFAASVDWATGWVAIHDSSPTGGLTASQKAAFFQMF